MQSLLGLVSQARWLRHTRAHLRHLFPYLPKQPGYDKRRRAASILVEHLIRALALDTAFWRDDVWVIDSTPHRMRSIPGDDPPLAAGRRQARTDADR